MLLRWRAGATVLCSKGLIYGICNEGLWAKTFLATRRIPVHEFEGYGVLRGIALAWAQTISLWQADQSTPGREVNVCRHVLGGQPLIYCRRSQ
jgi:hypothetical protein